MLRPWATGDRGTGDDIDTAFIHLPPVALPLAQAVAETLGGSAGWVGAGLLGLVLAWLFGKHLPAKDAQLERLLEQSKGQLTAKDAQLDATLQHKWAALEKMGEFHRDTVKALAAEFRTAIQELAAHCDKNEERLVSQMETSREGFIAVLKSKFGTTSSGQEPASGP